MFIVALFTRIKMWENKMADCSLKENVRFMVARLAESGNSVK
jgi:hypothetical protein